MNIVLLAGSPSADSRSTRLLLHIGERLGALGHNHTTVQVRDLPAQALLHADFGDAALLAAQAQIGHADALVIATPIYKAAYSGILKAFLDLLPQNGLAGKAVLPLAVGGSQSHMLALDYALRPVLSSLGAPHILPSIYATETQVKWTGEQGLILDAAIAERIGDGVDHLHSILSLSLRASDLASDLAREFSNSQAAPLRRSA
jgi:FMN reductase